MRGMSLRTTSQTSPISMANCKTTVPIFLHQSTSDTVNLVQPMIFMTLPQSNSGNDITNQGYYETQNYAQDSDHSNTAIDYISQSNDVPSTSKDKQLPVNEIEQSATCAVCGEDGAKTHYSVLSCLGCKGFFRRALKKADQYECINDNKCVINKYGRNSCRACRLRKCLEAGMDPAAVRPDRDFIGKQQSLRLPQIKKNKNQEKKTDNQSNITKSGLTKDNHEDLIKKLPVEMRTMLMNLLNIEVKVSRGDTLKDAREVYPLHINTVKELIENPAKLKGKRTEMRYEPYRMAKNEELSVIVYRRLIAAIDWVDLLADMVDGLSTDDKISLVKSCYAPLLLFKCSARTAMVTERENILCLCNFAYVPLNMGQAYSDSYHLDNGLTERLINELVLPFRKIQLKEEELVCLCAIIVMNPMSKDLSEDGIKKVSALRDKIQDTLFQYIKETRPNTKATSQFGNLLLYLPILANLANVLCENLRFAQTFSTLGNFPLLTSLFGCFPVEPFLDAEIENEKLEIIRKNAEVQTDLPSIQQRGIKRRLPDSFVSPVENESSSEHREFRLLRPPCSYTLTEMFEDRMNQKTPIDNNIDVQFIWPPRQGFQSSTSNYQQQLLPTSSSSRTRDQYYNNGSIQNQKNKLFHCQSIPQQSTSTSNTDKRVYSSDILNNENPSQSQISDLYRTNSSTTMYSTPPIENLSFNNN